MTPTEFLKELQSADSVAAAEVALRRFQAAHRTRWIPVGRENNRGTVEVSSDPARSAVERLR
jgi:hypothetical protein